MYVYTEYPYNRVLYDVYICMHIHTYLFHTYDMYVMCMYVCIGW